MRSILISLFCVLILAGCQSAPLGSIKPWPWGKSKQTDKANADVIAAKLAAKLSTKPRKKYTRGNKSPYVVFGQSYEVMDSNKAYREIGIASWYGKKFHGRLTSNGEVYDMYQLSAAHKALPLPTVVRVTNLDNGASVVVRVNDRGPFHGDRLIDLSYETARVLGFVNQGTAPVVVEALDEINHPEQSQPVAHEAAYYLQVGAFSKVVGAETLLSKIEALLVAERIDNIDVRILQSEIEQGLLHKVWLGPIENTAKRESIALLVAAANLGSPINVEVK